MKLNQIVGISKILSDRKVPDDVEKFHSKNAINNILKSYEDILWVLINTLTTYFV